MGEDIRVDVNYAPRDPSRFGHLLSRLEGLLQSEQGIVDEMKAMTTTPEFRKRLIAAPDEKRGEMKLAVWIDLLESHAGEANVSFVDGQLQIGDPRRDSTDAATDQGIAIRYILRYAQENHPEVFEGATSVEEVLNRLVEKFNR
jgi:prepilin-type processing-associated H-X9-DG protein